MQDVVGVQAGYMRGACGVHAVGTPISKRQAVSCPPRWVQRNVSAAVSETSGTPRNSSGPVSGQRSALRAAAHKDWRQQQQQRDAQQLRPEALSFVPNSDQTPPPTMQQRNTAAEMEVGEEGRVSKRNVQQAHTAATCTREGWSQAHPPPAVLLRLSIPQLQGLVRS